MGAAMTYSHDRQRECDEWHIPYFPTEEELNDIEDRAQYAYEVMRQLEIDEEANNVMS
jgi:hypothetical protein